MTPETDDPTSHAAGADTAAPPASSLTPIAASKENASLLSVALAVAGSTPAPPAGPDALLALLDNPDAPRREQAFTLYCHGFRSTAIAGALGVHTRTVQRWLGDMRQLIAAESRTDHAAELLRAIQSHLTIASAAWDAYEHERDLERQVLSGELDHIRRRVRHTGRTRIHPSSAPAGSALDLPPGDEETVLEEVDRPRIPRQGARFLAVALAAQREVARLQGLYDQIQRERPPINIHVSMNADGEDSHHPDASAASAASDSAAPGITTDNHG